ncbi:flagellar biosynthesis regulator FlaF [Rhodobacterales bacterium HKCCE2091]|nr:flagellar biosynthesis regulator FlaF [Rhodobacterales bacterium HKCCE2091]
MYSTHLAQAAYSTTDSPVRTDRGTEHAAFEKVTSRLAAADAPGAAFRVRAAAIQDNRRLWTILASDALDPENGLPPRLRAQIVYLYEFTQDHCRKALRNEASLRPLIEINTAVMRGLRGEKGTP